VKFITTLKPYEIFVFGSNLAGIHGAGAAKQARNQFGAEMGVGEGLTGQCYALPTLDTDLEQRSLEHIQASVERFFQQARNWRHKTFLVTPVGCGLAGFNPEQIAPLFKHAPPNCILPEEFITNPTERKATKL
jgi:hypothetical protein